MAKTFEERLKECGTAKEIFGAMPHPDEGLDEYQVLELRAKRAGLNIPAAHCCGMVASTIKMFENKNNKEGLDNLKRVLCELCDVSAGG